VPDSADTALRETLSDVLHGAGVAGGVSSLTRLTGGASRETWHFIVGGEPFILQRQRPGTPRDMHVEVAVLEAAYAAGVPVAEVVTSSRGMATNPLGEPFMVVRAVEGETIARKILRDDTFGSARPQLAAQIGRAMAQIHRIDHASIDGLEGEDQVAKYVQLMDESGQAHPAFEIAFRWLEANRPAPRDWCLVHGDFRLGNVIVGNDGLRAVLDWELAHVGNPAEDLGWVCVRAWRFGGSKPVAGVGDYEQLLNAYETESGVRIEERELRWWELLGTVKWGLMCISQSAYHLNGVVRSHELAAIGRRVCENEYDALMTIRELSVGAQ
jgi:aminoglycoside phosphotransferase (APT) family kinase protein